MGDLRYDPRALHIGPFTGTEMGIAQVPANEKLLIAALDASIRTAEYHADLAERSGSGSADARYRAVKLPYLRGVVPVEVLIPIFRLLVEQTEKERSRQIRQGVKLTSNSLKAAYRLSLVCRKWRSTALSDPSLWRYIPADINSPDEVEYIKKAVDLAKGAGIAVSATHRTCWPDLTWKALQVPPPRISQVEVIVECQGYIGSINWPVGCIVDKWINFLRPGVQYAAVGVPGNYIQHVPESIEYYNLHSLLDFGDAAWQHAPPVTIHWTSDAFVTPESLITLFRRTPHLQTLHLDWSSWAGSTFTAPFAVRNLQRLRLNIFSIVEAYTVLQDIVQLCSLSSLWLIFPTDRAEPLPIAAWRRFVTFNRTASATFSIQSLVISSLRFQPVEDRAVKARITQLLDILAEMPGVHSLILKDFDAEILLRAMLDDTRIPPVLPTMTNLTLKRCRVLGETLFSWVKRRIPSNDPALSISTRPSSTTALTQVRSEDCPGISNREWNQTLEIVNSSRH